MSIMQKLEKKRFEREIKKIKYLMEESDKFSDWMKAKKKLGKLREKYAGLTIY